MFLLSQAATTELLAARAARGSSRDPSGRRQDTSAGERGSVLSTRLRGTDVNTAASGTTDRHLSSSQECCVLMHVAAFNS